MTMAPGNYIAHNHFNDLSRNGVFAFRNQGGNVVEYNHIHNALQTTVDAGCIHFATMNHLNAPNYILNNWLYDIWGYEQKPDGNPARRQAHGVYLDWDTSNTTVKDNWIYNYKGNAVAKVFGGNWNVGHYRQPVLRHGHHAAVRGRSRPRRHGDQRHRPRQQQVHRQRHPLHGRRPLFHQRNMDAGVGSRIRQSFYVRLTSWARPAVPSEAIYTLPITEDGFYQISLLYKPGSDRASNVPITIKHADGTANVTWNMQQGSIFGFAVAVGTYRFVAAETNTVTLSTTGVNGKVIADSVGFVKIENNAAPVATNVQVAGSAQVGGTLTGSYDLQRRQQRPRG